MYFLISFYVLIIWTLFLDALFFIQQHFRRFHGDVVSRVKGPLNEAFVCGFDGFISAFKRRCSTCGGSAEGPSEPETSVHAGSVQNIKHAKYSTLVRFLLTKSTPLVCRTFHNPAAPSGTVGVGSGGRTRSRRGACGAAAPANEEKTAPRQLLLIPQAPPPRNHPDNQGRHGNRKLSGQRTRIWTDDRPQSCCTSCACVTFDLVHDLLTPSGLSPSVPWEPDEGCT